MQSTDFNIFAKIITDMVHMCPVKIRTGYYKV